MQPLTIKHLPYLPIIPVLVGLVLGILPQFMPGLILLASIALAAYLAYVTTEEFGIIIIPKLPYKSGSYILYMLSALAWTNVFRRYDWFEIIVGTGITGYLLWEIHAKKDNPFQT